MEAVARLKEGALIRTYDVIQIIRLLNPPVQMAASVVPLLRFDKGSECELCESLTLMRPTESIPS